MTFATHLEALGVLGLDGNATREDIKSAYHRLAAVCHPDARGDGAGDSSEAFLRIRGAYEYLMDAYAQAVDAYLRQQARPDVGYGDAAAMPDGTPQTAGNVTWQTSGAAGEVLPQTAGNVMWQASGAAGEVPPRSAGNVTWQENGAAGEVSPQTAGNVTWQANGAAGTGARIIGNMAAVRQQAANRHFAQERLKQERRLEKQRSEKKRSVDERLRAYQEDLAYEEAMQKIHAIRAAEITLALYEASLKGVIGGESAE